MLAQHIAEREANWSLHQQRHARMDYLLRRSNGWQEADYLIAFDNDEVYPEDVHLATLKKHNWRVETSIDDWGKWEMVVYTNENDVYDVIEDTDDTLDLLINAATCAERDAFERQLESANKVLAAIRSIIDEVPNTDLPLPQLFDATIGDIEDALDRLETK